MVIQAGNWWLERVDKDDVIQQPNFEKDMTDFVSNYLGKDGVFVMRLVSWNTGVAFTGALLMYLYVNYCDFKNTLQNIITTEERMQHEDMQKKLQLKQEVTITSETIQLTIK